MLQQSECGMSIHTTPKIHTQKPNKCQNENMFPVSRQHGRSSTLVHVPLTQLHANKEEKISNSIAIIWYV